MPTQAQLEILENIEASIRFLKDLSGQTNIKIGDVLDKAGYDKAGTKLYPLIKSLRLRDDEASLLRLRSALLEVAVRVNPLEEWHQDYESGRSGSMSKMLRQPFYDDTVEPFPEADEVNPFRLMHQTEEHLDLTKDETPEADYVPSVETIERNQASRTTTYESEETALMTVMRALKGLSSDQRARIFQAAESFYAVGMR